MTQYAFLLCSINILFFIASHAVAVASDEDDSPDKLKILNEFLSDQELFERKIRAFDKLYVGIAKAAYIKAKSLEQEGKQTEAKSASDEAQSHLKLVKAAYEMGLDHFDSSAVLHNFYGEILHDFFSQPNEAAEHWKRAIQLNPKFARALCNFGMYALHNGMYSTGLANMDAALSLNPDNPDFLYNMVQAYLVHSMQIMQARNWSRVRIFQEAMEMSKKAACYAPEDFDLLRDHALNYFLGEDFGVVVDWKEAAKAWQTARAKARNDAETFNAWLHEARVHRYNEDKKKALECLDKAQAIWPDSPVVKQLIDDFKE